MKNSSVSHRTRKGELRNRKKEGLPMKKKLIYLLAAVTLTAAVWGAGPMQSRAVDLSRKGSMMVHSLKETEDNKAMAEDIKTADVVVDVYQVATAVKTEGYDSYTYAFLSSYGNPDTPEDAAGWNALAQETAKTALGGTVDPVRKEQAVETSISDLEPGLYLLIARSRNLTTAESYQIDMELKDGAEGETVIATIANSGDYQYAFMPQLISLPMRGTGDTTVVPNMTADRGPWVFDLDVYMKPEQSPRFGALEIVKTLSSYETEAGLPAEPATFVFRVDGVIDGETVYSEVESITFTAAGEERVRLDRIPVTADVTVTEIYSGSSYQAEVTEPQTAVISAEQVASVSFRNFYDGHQRNGHGIKNQFTYEGAGSRSGEAGSPRSGRWNWAQDPVQGAGEDN